MPKNNEQEQATFWDTVPRNSQYDSLRMWEGKTFYVTAVTDFTGTYSECFVLHAFDSDAPLFEEDKNERLILVSKGYEGRDTVCNLLRDYLAEHPGSTVAMTVRKVKNFYALEQPR